MQKFGLQTKRANKHLAIELAIAREQASALGRAGRKLRLSLEHYQDAIDKSVSDDEQKELIELVSKSVWELMLQREFIGFIEGNLRWVKENYVIPDETLKF